PAPAPAPAKDVAATDLPRESISEKIAEIELRLREDRRNEIVEKILQKNAVQQQKHLRLIGWIPFLRRLADLLRSYGKSILHKTHTHFSKIHVMQPLIKARKIRL
ncbi:relaxase, partial [Escherichia coli]